MRLILALVIIFFASCKVDLSEVRHHYFMELVGHGHHSGKNGMIYKDLSSITTAQEMVDFIVVGVEDVYKDL